MSKILVAGSYNESMTVVSPKLPRPGETALGTEYHAGPGGKGANQAIGAARLGAETALLVKLGDDAFGAAAEQLFLAEGLPAATIIRTTAAPTGVALIMVDELGANQIAVAPGANSLLAAADAPSEALAGVAVLLCQLECPVEVFQSLAPLLPEAVAILNPAPAQALSDECCRLVDFLTPNESELSVLTGLPTEDDEQIAAAAERLLARGVRNVVATVGARGAMWFTRGDSRSFPAPKVPVVDTTGAGDAFNAGLAVGLSRGYTVPQSIELGVRCGAFCVTQSGVIDGLARESQLPRLADAGAGANAGAGRTQ